MAMLSLSVRMNGISEISTRLNKSCRQSENKIARRIKTDTDPFVPWLNGILTAHTYVDGRFIIYDSDYARYLYNGFKMVDRETGRGPMHFIDKNLKEHIVYHKGAKLRETDIPLDIKRRSGHRQAQAHWFEASKAQNEYKWLLELERLIPDEFRKLGK